MLKTDEEYKDIIREIFQDVAKAGHEASNWDEDFFRQRAERYLHDIKFFNEHFDSGKILEIGSLPCHVTLFMKRLGYDITGVDIDPSRIQKLIDANDLEVLKCDIEWEKLPVEDGSYDAVIFTEVFEHLRVDPLFVLSEINRVLKKGGFVFFSTPNLYSLEKWVRFNSYRGFNNPLEQFKKLRETGHMGHVREYSKKELSAFLKDSGMKIIDSRYHNYHKYDHGIINLIVNILMLPSRALRTRQIHIAQKESDIEYLKPLSHA